MFAGYWYDKETGLYNCRARYYDPKSGRFISADPIGFGAGINFYSYCNNNPVNYIDPLGLAYFALRPLQNFIWIPGISHNPLDDAFNTEVAHEQIFFEDGKKPSNIGFFGENGGILKEETNPTGYRKTKTGYDDCVMRKAVAKVPPRTFSLLGKPGPTEKYNCQDWCSDVRRQYRKLIRDSKVRKECCLD